jgi:hypothetical protein
VPTDTPSLTGVSPTTESITAIASSRASIPHTAATSPNLRCSVSGRLGSPPGPAVNRAITSSSVPKYTCSTIRGRPPTRAEVAAYR